MASTIPTVIASPSPYVTDPSPATTAPLPSEAEATPTEVGEPFCAQRGSRLFHRRECAWVRHIPEAERVELKQISDARDQGFKECPICEP